MLKTSLLMALFVTTSLFAQTENCLGKLCKGDVVIDANNYVGVVMGIKNGQVLYRRKGNDYENTASSGFLVEKTNSSKFPTSSYVIDPNNYVGKVINAFEDGRVEYQREGNDYSNVSNSVSPEVPVLNGVKKDVNVIDENNYVGKAKRVFENNKVQYQREGNDYSNISSKVSPEIPEKNGIVKGKKVIDENNYVGVTFKVFNDGRIQYRRAGNTYENISSKVSPEVTELNNIKAGKNVIDENNYSGVAKTVFSDGRVEYRRDGNDYNNTSNKLAYEIPALKNGTKSGTVVLDSNNYVGSTKIVYNDGRTLYRRQGNDYNNVGSGLSYEVDEHKEYVKEVEYATPSHTIGEVIHFFSNGSIEVGGEDYNKICDKLFVESTEVDGVKVGTEVVLPAHTAVVERIFENSTARILADGKNHDIHVLKTAEIEEQSNRLAWIAEIRTSLLYPQFKSISRIAVKKEDYKKLLEQIKKDVDGPYIGLNKDEKKKMKEFIETELQKQQ